MLKLFYFLKQRFKLLDVSIRNTKKCQPIKLQDSWQNLNALLSANTCQYKFYGSVNEHHKVLVKKQLYVNKVNFLSYFLPIL